MTGLRRDETAATLLARLEAVHRLPFAERTWRHAWENIAIDHDVTLVHCDADFEAMKPTLDLRTLDWTTALR